MTADAVEQTAHGEAVRHTSPLLQRRGAVAGSGPDAGVAWHYGDPTAEQRALTRGGAVVDQSNLGVVRVAGPDRLSWLNSITSQEVAALPPRTSTELLVLSPQGHVEHAAAVVDDGEATWLVTETPVALAAWLNRMKFMLRVEIDDVTDDWAAIGEPVDAEGAEGEPVTWRDPWPTTAPGGTRYGPSDEEHPGADRAWRLVLVPAVVAAAVVAASAVVPVAAVVRPAAAVVSPVVPAAAAVVPVVPVAAPRRVRSVAPAVVPSAGGSRSVRSARSSRRCRPRRSVASASRAATARPSSACGTGRP
ncbi:YgfZ/GcvT domain-containing protein [Cellulomonas septica]|uniref:YgfZ/GcvT domain-containing protein n=1 Tax=Cellulomonas septica TaxID=285080 RepID=UPI003CCD137C